VSAATLAATKSEPINPNINKTLAIIFLPFNYL
jgi:hypothetical protein